MTVYVHWALWYRIFLPSRRHGFDPWVSNLAREKEMAGHCSILAWEILWLEDPGRLLSMGRKELDTTE